MNAEPARRPIRSRSWRRVLLLSACAALSAARAAAAPTDPVPPGAIVYPEGERHVGKIVFVELITPDLGRAQAFYSALFGWTFQTTLPTSGPPRADAYFQGRRVGRLIGRTPPAGESRQSSWLSFISVRDVGSVTDIGVGLGAKVLVAPRFARDLGREAVMVDPQGAVFAVLATPKGDPADDLPEPGEWIWSSLITSDPDVDAAFYQQLFDYDVFDLPDDAGGEHLILSTESYARASANSLPKTWINTHPHWLNFVRVDDAQQKAAQVVALGGRVLVDPHPDRQGGKIAIVADPLGAPFGLMEWTPTENSREASR